MDFQAMEPGMGYSPLEMTTLNSYFGPTSNPFQEGTIDAYGTILNPYGVESGWMDSYGSIHDPTWGNQIGWIDSYNTIRDAYDGSFGTINPYGVIVSPYSY